ncbi:ABC transporter ATP-binding protein [Shouchella miscanthi]|uniref:ABC transporter ATP-binding protein n=1 Tax=Shouchella miscanthi TaxID=2598861 RepID=A0ABU6NQC5_9BACI|nr:ABC transporter ATP-binding protein [Shouchella miscanthi]
MTKPIMQLENVTVSFEGRDGGGKKVQMDVLQELSLDIFSGEILAIVGESGCGKSTLGKVLAGLHRPAEGTYRYEGQDSVVLKGKEKKAFRLGVQLIQQDSYAALNPSRTIFQSLKAPLVAHRLTRGAKQTRKRVTELLETVGLTPVEQFVDKFPHQLSGGQRQRVLMARAISLNPRVIIADEPVSMVDVSLRLSILNLMSRLNKELGIAFIYITHDLATARFIAQKGRLAVMYLGRIVELSEVGLMMNQAQHPYMQALLSAVPLPHPKMAKLKKQLPIKGYEVPKLTSSPTGCHFHPRCPYATEECERETPQLREGKHGVVACHHAERIPVWTLPHSSASSSS